MKQLRTAYGQEFDITWDGPSTFDGALRFAVVNSDVDSVHNAFRSPENTRTITVNEDGIERVYTGFTDYRGISKKNDGEIVVTLSPD